MYCTNYNILVQYLGKLGFISFTSSIFKDGFHILTTSRYSLLHDWLCEFFKIPSITLHALTGDAGFRKYYRFEHEGVSFIAVDAIPQMSNNLAFVELQKLFKANGVNVPDIICVDLSEGFFCLSDFGDLLFGNTLTETNMEQEYKKAIDLLPNISAIKSTSAYTLPNYDAEFVHTELNIFTEWLLGKHLNISLSTQEIKGLEQSFTVLVNNVLEQPKVTMHRDFHSRNLMVLTNDKNDGDEVVNHIGVIDFQDAVTGPITYDVVSLLRDCYVKWPQESVENLFEYFCQLMQQNESYSDISSEQWKRWFDLMGVQRHVKASGIFARLYHRDDKQGYLKDIPLTLSYIVEVCELYPELHALRDIVSHKVIPAIEIKG